MAAVAPAPAALLATWGVLVVVLLTEPIRPYTAGVWANADLLSLAVVGGVIGLSGRPLAAAATGIALGVAAAVAIELFVLAGQAVYQPVVVAGLDGRTWTASVAGAIMVGAVAMALGYALVRAALALRGIIRWRGPAAIASSATSAPTAMPIAIGAVALVTMGVAVIVLIGGSLFTTASPYAFDAATMKSL